MELRPGYKETEIGAIPTDWDLVNIGEIASVSAGGTPSRTNPQYWNGDIPWATTTEIDFSMITDTAQSISQDGLKNSAAKLLPAGTLLMALYGQGKTRGKVGILGIEATTNQACAAISLHADVSPEFIFHSLSGRYEFIRSLSNTGNQENLNGQIVRSIPVPMPRKRTEQRAIATALSDADALLDGLDRLIAKKRDLKQAAMQKLLTGKIRLPEFDKKQSFKETELGIIPEDWEVIHLSEIGKTLAGLTYSPKDVGEHGLLVLRSSNIQGGKLAFGDNVYVNMNVPDRVITEAGDILICVRNGSRQLIGKCALINEAAAGSAFGAFMSIFRSKSSGFVFYQFQSEIIQRQIRERMGATINQITNKDMAEFLIPVPTDFDEQTAIAKVLADMDAEIAALEQRRNKTKNIKQAMMQELLTGKTRLV